MQKIKEALGTDRAIIDHLFRPLGVEGVYARTGHYEDIIDALQKLFSRHRPAEAVVYRFPPVMSRSQLEKQGYLNSFPQLLGCVCCLDGSEAEIARAVDRSAQGADWTSETQSVDLVLSPAACYPVYSIAAQRGSIPQEGLIFDVAADCFRHEPSRDIDRLQSFRMREFVCIGDAARVSAYRDEWISRARHIADELQLACEVDRASDPFFGRAGQILAASQVEQALKFELLIQVRADGGPTACMSFNYHRDHFGKTWGLVLERGETAESACVAFGVDRLAVALFKTHGKVVSDWPSGVRTALALS